MLSQQTSPALNRFRAMMGSAASRRWQRPTRTGARPPQHRRRSTRHGNFLNAGFALTPGVGAAVGVLTWLASKRVEAVGWVVIEALSDVLRPLVWSSSKRDGRSA